MSVPVKFHNVNEEGVPYDSHDSLEPALTVLREFPNDSIVVVTVGSSWNALLDRGEFVATNKRAGDDYIIVRGGLVQNNPSLPVLDLDVLDSDITPSLLAETAKEVESLASLASDLGLDDIYEECHEWLDRLRENWGYEIPEDEREDA